VRTVGESTEGHGRAAPAGVFRLDMRRKPGLRALRRPR
jgi:hypothetical protein